MKNRIIQILVVVLVFMGIFFINEYLQEGSTRTKELTRYTATFLDVFDTQTEIVGYAKSQEEFNVAVEKIKEELTCYHQLYDIYNSYDSVNNLKTINDNAGITSVVVDEKIISLLKLSKEMFDLTDGKVNVAMGSVLSIWHAYREEGVAVPTMHELEEAAKHTDISHLIIDEENSTVYLEDPEMSLDVGGIGKGYAVQNVAEFAKENGINHLLISVGGNVCAVGGKPDGTNWNIGITNPNQNASNAFSEKVSVRDCSVVTSGNYQRYYMVDGVRYCHIIHPDTLMPANYFASVSIIAKDSGIADALSTAVYNMTLEEGSEFVNKMDDVEAMWIMEDGSMEYSEGFERFISK